MEPKTPHSFDHKWRWLRNALIGSLALFLGFKYIIYAAMEKGITSYGGIALSQICLVWMMIFAAWAFFSTRLPSPLRLSKQDMGYLFIFLFISSPLMLGTIYFVKQSTYIYYRGDKDPNVTVILQENMPRLAPENKALTFLYEGSPQGSIQWAPWFRSCEGRPPPFITWGLFLIFIWSMFLAIAFIFSKRWLQEEQLAFPLAQMGDLLVDGYKDPTSNERLPLLSTKVFWTGFAATFSFQMCTYLSPGLEWRVGSFSIKETVPWLGDLDYSSRNFWWRPVFVAIFFLCPRQILGSALIFHILQCVLTVLGCQMGYKGYSGSELPGASVFPFKQDQLFGGAVFFAMIMLWTSRHHIASQFQAMRFWGRKRPVPEKVNPIAMGVFMVSLTGFVAWTLLLGFQIKTTILFVLCLLLSVIINTRGRAETGMPMIHVFGTFAPLELVGILGTKMIGLKSIAVTAVQGWIFWNNLGHLTPSVMDSLKLGQQMRKSYRWALSIALTAAVVGTVLGMYVTLDSAYEVGLNKWQYQYGSGWTQVTSAVRLMETDVGPNRVHIGYALGGGLVTALLWFLRLSLPGFALHPMGYLLSLHSGLHHFSLALIIAYLAKSLIIHYGGIKQYINIVPFFIGLLVGQIVGGATVGLLNIIFNTNVYAPML